MPKRPPDEAAPANAGDGEWTLSWTRGGERGGVRVPGTSLESFSLGSWLRIRREDPDGYDVVVGNVRVRVVGGVASVSTSPEIPSPLNADHRVVIRALADDDPASIAFAPDAFLRILLRMRELGVVVREGDSWVLTEAGKLELERIRDDDASLRFWLRGGSARAKEPGNG